MEFACTLLLAAVAWGSGYFVRGLVEDERRDAKRFAKWEREASR